MGAALTVWFTCLRTECDPAKSEHHQRIQRHARAGIYVRWNTERGGLPGHLQQHRRCPGGGVRLYGGRAMFTKTDIYNSTAPQGAGMLLTLVMR